MRQCTLIAIIGAGMVAFVALNPPIDEASESLAISTALLGLVFAGLGAIGAVRAYFRKVSK